MPTSLAAECGNLSAFWPLEPPQTLRAYVKEFLNLSFSLDREPRIEADSVPSPNVTLVVEYDGQKHDLATLPALYDVSLTILTRKFEFHRKLYQALANVDPDTRALNLRELDLRDHSLREVIYIGRVVNLVVQWTQSIDHPEICLPLLLFVTQEYISTDHSLENTRDVRVTLVSAGTLRECESAGYPLLSVDPMPTAMDDWLYMDNDQRLWLKEGALQHVDRLVEWALSTPSDDYQVR